MFRGEQITAQEVEKKISLADLGWWGIAILIILLAGGGIGYYVCRRNRDSEQQVSVKYIQLKATKLK